MIEFTGEAGNLKISVEDCLGTRITAGDIANFLVQQVTDDRFFRQAPFIANMNFVVNDTTFDDAPSGL